MRILVAIFGAMLLMSSANGARADFYGPVSADLICKNIGNRNVVVSGQKTSQDMSDGGGAPVTTFFAQKYNKKATDDLSILGVPCTEGQAWMNSQFIGCSTSLVSPNGENGNAVLFGKTLSNQNAVGVGGGVIAYHYSAICGTPPVDDISAVCESFKFKKSTGDAPFENSYTRWYSTYAIYPEVDPMLLQGRNINVKFQGQDRIVKVDLSALEFDRASIEATGFSFGDSATVIIYIDGKACPALSFEPNQNYGP